MSVRLYAVLRLKPRSSASLPRGVRGERLRILKCAGCSVAVADARMALEPAVKNLLEFDGVIRALAAVSEAILPARFGAVSETVTALRSEIAERAEALAQALDNVSGRVQMTLRLPPRPSSTRKAVGSDVASDGGRGAKYLRTRATAVSPPALTKLRKALVDLVREERLEPGPDGTRVYHLIESGDVAAYVERLQGFRASGPFPPYAFVPGIDHAIWQGHDDEKDRIAEVGPPRSRSHRRSTRNTRR